MNTYCEFLEDYDSRNLAQSNSYMATDMQFAYIPDNNQGNYVSHFMTFDNINMTSNTLNKTYQASEQMVEFNYQVSLSLENGTFKNAAVTKTSKIYETAASTTVVVGNVASTNVVKDTYTTAPGSLVGSKNAFRLKGLHHFVDNVNAFELGNQKISRGAMNTNFYIEQELKKLNGEEYKKVSDALQWCVDDKDSYEVALENTKYIESTNKVVDDQTKKAFNVASDRYNPSVTTNNVTVVTKSNLQTILGNNANVSDYHDRIVLTSATDTKLTYTCYGLLPLRYVHDCFGKIPSLLNINGYRLILQLNIGTNNSWSVTYKTYDPLALADVEYYDVDSVSCIQPIGKTCPFLLAKAGPSTAVQNDLTMIPDDAAIKMKLTISAVVNPNKSEPCRLIIPYSEYNDLSIIKNNSKARILYNDIYTDNILNIGAGAPVNKSFNFSIPRTRFLFIIPYLADSVVEPSQSPLCSAPVSVSPHRMSYFQLQIGTTNIYQKPLQYSHEFYESYKQYMGSERDGNAWKSSDMCGLVSRDMYDLNYGVICIDLKRVLNENLDSQRKTISLTWRNDSGVPMNYFLIMSSQAEIVIDRILCQVELPVV